MATANIIELKTCMADCLNYCETHADKEFVDYHFPRLQQANRKFKEAVQVSDNFYRAFANASIDDKKAWKAASTKVRDIQKRLERYEVSGYPKNVVLYWDVPLFRGHAQRLLTWMSSNPNAYPDIAADEAELRRLCENAEQARVTRDDALDDYAKQAQFRASALGTLAIFLSEFRQTLRRHLGEKNTDYQAIRWPFSLSPDRPVLL